VIAGTEFTFRPPEFVTQACRDLDPRIVSPSEIQEIQAECEADRATCMACDDVMVVFDLRGHDGALEMFIWIVVALKHGAYERQSAAVHAIARDLGAATMAFHSRRRGWSRRLGPEWHPRGTAEFTRRV
jgi:hypothetical protein